MSDAPDRIYYAGGHAWENPSLKRDKTEYIRADLHRVEVEAAVKRAIEACADKCAERALYIEDCVKWGGSKTYVTSLKGGIIELANVGPSIRALATDPAALERIINGGGNE
jgi:hypothetical protein